jgi:hypothetical protein
MIAKDLAVAKGDLGLGDDAVDERAIAAQEPIWKRVQYGGYRGA